jgi:hypothetical protein
MSETFKGIEYYVKGCSPRKIQWEFSLGRTKNPSLLLETIYLDGKVAPPHEHVVRGLDEEMDKISDLLKFSACR